jgi:hypothetical protein
MFGSPPHRTFHFMSGLPRAGSTLTAAVLRQRRHHAGAGAGDRSGGRALKAARK